MTVEGPETRLSVALCTHNGGRYIERQLDSILRQTRVPDEIIVSDDASVDDTIARVEQYSSHVTLLRNDSAIGVTANFEQAITATTGDLVALSDQDDLWVPDRIERLVSHFADPALLLVGSDARAIDEDDVDLGFDLFSAIGITSAEWSLLDSGRTWDALLRRNLFTGATMMFRRQLVPLAAPFPPHWLHDEWLAITAAAHGTARLLRDELTGYRQHGANVAGIEAGTLRNRLGKVRKLTAPRTHRHATQLARAEELTAGLQASGAPGGRLADAAEALEHERVRSGLARARILRVGAILAERRAGRYGKFDYGAKDILRDLLASPR